MASQFPTRLIVRCPVCRGVAVVGRDELTQAQQMFCSADGVPLIVFGVIAGHPLNDATFYGKPIKVSLCPKCQVADPVEPAACLV